MPVKNQLFSKIKVIGFLWEIQVVEDRRLIYYANYKKTVINVTGPYIGEKIYIKTLYDDFF